MAHSLSACQCTPKTGLKRHHSSVWVHSHLPQVRSQSPFQECSQGCFQSHLITNSQHYLLYSPKEHLKMLWSMLLRKLPSILPIALNDTLPAYLDFHFQVYSQVARHFLTHLNIYCHVCFCMLNPETWWVADTIKRESWGRWQMVGSV